MLLLLTLVVVIFFVALMWFELSSVVQGREWKKKCNFFCMWSPVDLFRLSSLMWLSPPFEVLRSNRMTSFSPYSSHIMHFFPARLWPSRLLPIFLCLFLPLVLSLIEIVAALMHCKDYAQDYDHHGQVWRGLRPRGSLNLWQWLNRSFWNFFRMLWHFLSYFSTSFLPLSTLVRLRNFCITSNVSCSTWS